VLLTVGRATPVRLGIISSTTFALKGSDATTYICEQRFDYGEVRSISAGFLEGRMVVVVLTQTRHQPSHHFDEVRRGLARNVRQERLGPPERLGLLVTTRASPRLN
jgi:hypothetical protein